MSERAPDDPIDKELQHAAVRDQAVREIQDAEGFMLVSYKRGTTAGLKGPTGYDNSTVYWGSPVALYFMVQVWLHDLLAANDGPVGPIE
jgi:hypothetical protein